MTLSAEEEIFSRVRLVTCLKTNPEDVSVSTNRAISLRFLSCLFPELDESPAEAASSSDDLVSSLSALSQSECLSETHLQSLLSLYRRLVQYESSSDVGDRLQLSRFLSMRSETQLSTSSAMVGRSLLFQFNCACIWS